MQPDIFERWFLYLQQLYFSMEHIPSIKKPADYFYRMDVDNLCVNHVNNFSTNYSLTKSNIKIQQSQDNEIKDIIEKINSNDDNFKQKFVSDSYSDLVIFKCKPKNKSNL